VRPVCESYVIAAAVAAVAGAVVGVVVVVGAVAAAMRQSDLFLLENYRFANTW